MAFTTRWPTWFLSVVVVGLLTLAVGAGFGVYEYVHRPTPAQIWAETCADFKGVLAKMGTAQSVVDADDLRSNDSKQVLGGVYEFGLWDKSDAPPSVRWAFSDFFAYVDTVAHDGSPDHHVTREQARKAAIAVDRWIRTCSPVPPKH